MNHSKILVQSFSRNINHIDSILKKNQPNHVDSVLEDSTTSVFDTTTTTTSGKSPSKGVTNPFAKKPETYNTLRNSPENIEENGNGTGTSSTTATKKSLSYDIFKEAASAAFSELNFGGKSAKYSKNKFIGNDDLDNGDDDDDFVAGDNDGVSVMKTSNKKSFFSSSSSNSNTFLTGTTTVPPPVPATTKHASKNLEFSNQISGVFVNSSNGNFNNNLFGSNFNQVLLFFLNEHF